MCCGGRPCKQLKNMDHYHQLLKLQVVNCLFHIHKYLPLSYRNDKLQNITVFSLLTNDGNKCSSLCSWCSSKVLKVALTRSFSET
ncbi:hypothetical protein L2E82_20817 [Cichorium intybus]|uniref:Uncharacterized protein n=1 Tax=Cichorium intybus TaxID=13427 RepID=A0ACB9DU26_CICIN|nr:hypothetical protein L2E82_20817 [Cichorium intybus]